MKNLQADVREINPKYWAGIGVIHGGVPEHTMKFGLPASVIIQEEYGSYMTYAFDQDGYGCGDTWHATLSDAQEGAKDIYGIKLNDWYETNKVITS